MNRGVGGFLGATKTGSEKNGSFYGPCGYTAEKLTTSGCFQSSLYDLLFWNQGASVGNELPVTL